MDIRFLDDSARSDPLYVNLEYLGEGGQAKVYKVKRVNDRLIMACKEIIVTLDATELHLIKRELESWAMINRKKYIAEYYDASWGPATNSIRLYMPLYKGGDLHKVLETALMEKQPLHPIVTSLCANEIAQGVQECHERDIIHRDLKPENVLLSSPFKLNTQLWKAAKGEFLTSTEKRELAAFLRARTTGIPWCHVADFGMAKITSKLLGNSHHGTRATFGQMGTPGFIAPETIDLTGTNAAKFTSKSDVYGLGCLIYCLCEGSPPFPHRVEPSKRVYKPISAQYPQQFRSLVERCVSLSPASRPGIRELTSDLKRLHKQILAENHWVDEFLSSNSALPLSPSSQSRPTRSRSPDTMMSLNNQLLEACKEGDAESARAALSAGASTSAVGSEQFYRYSPLHYAAKGGFVNVMEVILEYGVDINMKTPTLGGTALHIAVIGGHYDAVDYLISMNAFVNAKTKQHMTPIWGAVLPEGGKFDEVMLLKLLSRGADINAPNNKGWTILHGLAVEKDEDYVERMRVFLRYGPDVDIHDNDNYTPLHRAAAANNGTAIDLLVASGADVEDAGGSHGTTPLHKACWEKSGVAVKKLLAHGANTRAQSTFDGFLPIHIAARKGDTDIGRLLLDRDPSSIKAVDNDSWTPLHLAARWYSLGFVRLLLQRRADPAAKTNAGSTPFELTIPLVHKPIRNLLRAAQNGDWPS